MNTPKMTCFGHYQALKIPHSGMVRNFFRSKTLTLVKNSSIALQDRSIIGGGRVLSKERRELVSRNEVKWLIEM